MFSRFCFRAVFLISCFAALVLFTPRTGFSCTCVHEDITPAQAAGYADAIFTGIVVVAGTDSCPDEYVFEVTHAVKGLTECSVTMIIPFFSCTFMPVLGGEYVMYAYWWDAEDMCRPGLSTNICIRSAPIEYAQEDLLYFERYAPMYLTEWQGGGILAVDNADNVYAADTANNRVSIYNAQGTVLEQWGSEGTGDGEFQGLSGIAVDSDGNVFVADNGNYRVQKFDNAGNFVTKWGSNGTDPGQFLGLMLLAVDPSGTVYALDITGRVQKFDNNGVYMGVWSVADAVYDMEAAPDGTIQFIDYYTDRVLIYSSTGVLLDEWVPGCSPPHQFPSSPSSFTIRSDGRRCFIFDAGGPRIVEYTADGVLTGVMEVPSPESVACGSGDLVFVFTGGKVKVYGERSEGTTGLSAPELTRGPSLNVFPNPFNPGTRVRYQIDKPGTLTISVYDVRGRRIRELFRADRAAIDGFVDWDGRDDLGRGVTAGVYFVRLETLSGKATKKAIMLK